MAKKYIVGRAYVLNESDGIFCIGAMNLDRKYHLQEDLVLKTSNPTHSEATVGGVARNIAENLGRLDLNVNLISMGSFDQDFQHQKGHGSMY